MAKKKLTIEEARELAKERIREYQYWRDDDRPFYDAHELYMEWLIDCDFQCSSFESVFTQAYKQYEKFFDKIEKWNDKKFLTILDFISDSILPELVYYHEIDNFIHYVAKNTDYVQYRWVEDLYNWY